MAKTRRSEKSLSARKLRALDQLARRIELDERPSINEMGRAAFGRHDQLRSIVQKIKAHRVKQGLSLGDVARCSGIATPNLSRLENNPHLSPTLDTLDRYARAVGFAIQIELTAANAA